MVYAVDSSGQPLDGRTGRYLLRFKADAMPPVDAFWSITVYDKPKQLLVANPIDRYLINSAMLKDLVTDRNGDVLVHLQQQSPGEGKERNWLPAPAGGFYAIMRLYLPKPEALDGCWKAPVIETL